MQQVESCLEELVDIVCLILYEIGHGNNNPPQFMGFKRESALGVFNSVSLAASVYTVFGAIRKPESWRLFRYLPLDFYRKVDGMNRAALTMKIVGWGVSAKVSFDLISNASGQN